jgi:hypothetical protein
LSRDRRGGGTMMPSKEQVNKAIEYFKANSTFFNNEYIGYPNFEILIAVAQSYLSGEIESCCKYLECPDDCLHKEETGCDIEIKEVASHD